MHHLTPIKIFVAGIGFICIAVAMYAVVRMDTSSVTAIAPIESQGTTDWIPLTSRDGALSLKVPPTFEVRESQAFSATTRFAQSLGVNAPYADSLNLIAHGLTDECSLVGDSGTSTETIGAQDATFYVVRTDMGGSGNTGNRWVQVRYVHPVSATSCVAVSAAHMWSYTSATVSATTTEGIQQRKENAIVDAAFDKLLPQIIGTAFISATSTTESIADWKTYRNDEYGFEFKYPSRFYMVGEGTYSTRGVWLFSIALTRQDANSASNRTLVDVRQKDSLDEFLSELGDVYDGTKFNFTKIEKNI